MLKSCRRLTFNKARSRSLSGQWCSSCTLSTSASSSTWSSSSSSKSSPARTPTKWTITIWASAFAPAFSEPKLRLLRISWTAAGLQKYWTSWLRSLRRFSPRKSSNCLSGRRTEAVRGAKAVEGAGIVRKIWKKMKTLRQKHYNDIFTFFHFLTLTTWNYSFEIKKQLFCL